MYGPAADHQHLQPIREVPMLVVYGAEGLAPALKGVLGGKLPGFVIKAATYFNFETLEALEMHDEISKSVQAALKDITRTNFRVTVAANPLNIRPCVGIGELHTDLETAQPHTSTLMSVHTTAAGAGKVLLAQPGPRMQTVSDTYRSTRLYPNDAWTYERTANRQLAAGLADPTLVNPIFHTTYVKAGDTTIFPLQLDRGPTFHRFDTTAEPRTAISTLIESCRVIKL